MISPLTDAEIAALCCPAGTRPGPIAADMSDAEILANSGGMLRPERARASARNIAWSIVRAYARRLGWSPAQEDAAFAAYQRIPVHAIDKRGKMRPCDPQPVLLTAAERALDDEYSVSESYYVSGRDPQSEGFLADLMAAGHPIPNDSEIVSRGAR